VIPNLGLTNELRTLTWNGMSAASVVVEGVGPVQPGQRTGFPVGTQSATFLISRNPGSASTFVGGGPGAF
jgi:hypothetical protein